MMGRLVVWVAALVWGALPGCSGDDADDPSSGGGDSGTLTAGPDAASEDAASRGVDPEVHFHHVHVNTTDVAGSEAYYARVFDTVKFPLDNGVEVVKADGAFILLDEVETMPPENVDVGIEHFGWGSTDMPAWWEDAMGRDIEVDPRDGLDGLVELFPGFHFVYLLGPSNERIEVNTADHDEFGHVHFMTDDVDATVAWYEQLLGVEANMESATELVLDREIAGTPVEWSSNAITIDKVNMIFFGPPFAVPESFAPSDEYPFGHVAFSFTDLGPALERIEQMGVEVVSGPAEDPTHGFRSVFVRAPNQVLVELVEAEPIPNPQPDADESGAGS